MVLVLKIENETSLPDGGPLSVSIQGTRGIDIGRDQYLDWTLPDPSRLISGKHCEVRWHDGAHWLHDVSTNGTFLYGADGRLKAPHKLRDGDRFLVGHYVILASVSGENANVAGETPPTIAPPPGYDKLWDPVGEVAPPIDPKQLKAPRDLQPVKPDFLDWAVDLPSSYKSAQPESFPPGPGSSRRDVPGAPVDDMTWAQGAPKPTPVVPQPEPTPVPNPRRPNWVAGEPDGPWAGSSSSAGAVAPLPMSAAHERSAATDGSSMNDLMRAIARGAGLPEEALAGREPTEVAAELGQLIRLATENMVQLLEARQQAKRLSRSSSQTTIQALENNPLKFAPTPDEAMRIMFGPPTKSYLGARDAFTQGFGDLKAHQIKTFSAMQQALKQLLDELDPAAIEKASTGDRGLAGLVGSRKARLWDTYVTRWQAHAQGQRDGMLNVFMDFFAKCYDRDGNLV
jgi:type VI secretion system protein ImpI